jgi:hypothetical protein
MDSWAAQAREHHRLARDASGSAAQHRQQRDLCVMRLRSDGWSLGRIAKAIGCSKELIALIVRNQSVESPS